MGEIVSFGIRSEILKVRKLTIGALALDRSEEPLEAPRRWRRSRGFRVYINPRPNRSEVSLIYYRQLSDKLTEIFHSGSRKDETIQRALEREIAQAIGWRPGARVDNKLHSPRRSSRLDALRTYTQYAEKRSAYLRSRIVTA